MTTSPSDTSASDWRYVSEGGATAVFSYRGPSHPSFSSRVLRLRKRPHTLPVEDVPSTADLVDPLVEFQQKVIARLIDPDYLVEFKVVPLTQAWLVDFALHHEQSRPLGRRSVDGIDIYKLSAILATDLVGGQVCSIEIKPKWGFLPMPHHLSPESLPIKTKTCRTCMHCHLKQVKGGSAAADYCPLDLFSGTPERVSQAVAGLFTSWQKAEGSFNNLRIFFHGRVVNAADVHSVLKWAQATLECEDDSSFPAIQKAFTRKLVPLLLETQALQTLAYLQRTFDALDIEGLAKIVGSCSSPATTSKADSHVSAFDGLDPARKKVSCFTSAHFAEPSMDEWTSFVEGFISQSKLPGDPTNPDINDLRSYILAYLLSASFKDCSIIVPISHISSTAIENTVKVIDLDTKSVEKFTQWDSLDREIVREYAKIDEVLRKHCVDESSR
ncbi:hypothetical protein FA95DRAFT_1551673 [Auriscalpium vulgare]|uniref:Uncharacterized protein n=1 Tax=Auriscalpium vulgare TaxID=40419 RepID=A0ACB8SCF3_9AGAM|nr:hypothetical protein FA95DRAFT_1551673 [Auriscalpium vulgare]